MSDKETLLRKLQKTAGLLLGNFIQFAGMMAFLLGFQAIFGAENMLVGVALAVGLTSFPKGYTGMRRIPAALMIFGLYAGCALLGQTALLSPWIAFPLNLVFVIVILCLSMEPEIMKPSISFLLCFVFSQSTAVAWAAFPTRLLGAALGGALVAGWTLLSWKRANLGGRDSRSCKEQIALCSRNHSYILRMSIGIAAAMFAGMMLHLQKPLWISVVVMSLTQVSFSQTTERIRHRSLGTVVGAILFVLFFRLLIPPQYDTFAVLFIGYISYFMPSYKHKQVINAISALFASLVLFDTGTAIINRFLCLLGGIAIVLVMYLAEACAKRCHARFSGRPIKLPWEQARMEQSY